MWDMSHGVTDSVDGKLEDTTWLYFIAHTWLSSLHPPTHSPACPIHSPPHTLPPHSLPQGLGKTVECISLVLSRMDDRARRGELVTVGPSPGKRHWRLRRSSVGPESEEEECGVRV